MHLLNFNIYAYRLCAGGPKALKNNNNISQTVPEFRVLA